MPPRSFIAYIELFRPLHWVKNLLLFAPLFFSGAVTGNLIWLTIYGFLAFCLAASGNYALNDAIDVERDRKHPAKQLRPIPSGRVSWRMATVTGLALIIIGVIIGYRITPEFGLVVGLYVSLSLLYSLWLKNIPLVDILTLSLLFLIRLLAGVAATQIQPSSWIIIFTWLLSLMLVVGKRHVELIQSGGAPHDTRPVLGRYPKQFLRQLIGNIGAASLVCYLLWSQEAVEQHRFTALQIYPSGLFVAFGILRYQILIFTDGFREDPTVGIIADGPILSAIILFVAYVALLLYI